MKFQRMNQNQRDAHHEHGFVGKTMLMPSRNLLLSLLPDSQI
jgi:hypothetical protein